MVNRQDFRPNTTSRSGYSEYERKELQTPRVRDRKGVVDSFILGTKAKTGNESLSTDGNTLYSYQTAIATKQSDGSIVLNNTKYSNTTTNQQNEVRRQLDDKNIKYDVTGGKDRGYSGEDFSETDLLKKYNYDVNNKEYKKERKELK